MISMRFFLPKHPKPLSVINPIVIYMLCVLEVYAHTMIALPRYQLYLRHASHHLGPHQRCHTRYPVNTTETTSPSHEQSPQHQLYFALSIYLETLSLPFTYFFQPAPHPCPPRPIRTLNRFIALT